MKRLLFFSLLLVGVSLYSQESITLRIVRPSRLSGAASVINLSVQGDAFTIKNGGTLVLTLTPDYVSPIKIEGRLTSQTQANLSINPKPGETYEVEVGFNFNGIYIELKKGEEAKPGEVVYVPKNETDTTKWSSSLKVDRKTGGFGLKAEKDDPSEAIRKEWLQKGGRIKSESTMLTGMFFSMDIDGYGELNGYGGGISMYENYFKLKVPEYKEGFSSWNSFNAGYGFDWLLSSTKYTIDQSMFSMSVKSFSWNMLFAGNLGWTLGLGTFRGRENWKGVALTFKYRPTLNFTMTNSTIETKSSSPYIPNSKTSSTDSDYSFNAVGFGFDLQFSNFYATMEKLAPKPAAKFSFFFLPPTDKSPLFISLSLGILVYSQPGAKRGRVK
jgi:hypothetical protein